MKKYLFVLAAFGWLYAQTGAYAAEDYGRPDNICGQLHADKSGAEKDAAITRCIQERYIEQRNTGTQEIEHAKRKQCEAGPASSEKEKRQYMGDCEVKTTK